MRMNSLDDNTNDSQGDRRATPLPDADRTTHTVGKSREHVVQDVAQSGQTTPQSPVRPAQPKGEEHYQAQPLQKTSGRHPGEVSPELGQDSGSDWQESQQMGQTGRGGVQNPQQNP